MDKDGVHDTCQKTSSWKFPEEKFESKYWRAYWCHGSRECLRAHVPSMKEIIQIIFLKSKVEYKFNMIKLNSNNY